MTSKSLSKVNTLLLGVIIVVNSYIIIAPFVPALQLWYKERFAKQQQQQLSEQVDQDNPIKYIGPNKLVIPQMFLDQPVLEGPNIYTANKGIWRLPESSTPDKGGNTVLIGHRFLYSTKPAVFYSLDKLNTGDRVGLFWDNIQYIYEVSEVKVVSPSQTDIESATDDDRLTIYTCTPLWTSKNRLVVIAKRIGG